MLKADFVSFWKQKVRRLKILTVALYFASRDPRVPWYAKACAALVVAYAFSPIDLIPDFIPVLGYLDDLILMPLGIFLVVRMIPPVVMEECKHKAEEQAAVGKEQFRFMGAVVVAVWALAIVWVVALLLRR